MKQRLGLTFDNNWLLTQLLKLGSNNTSCQPRSVSLDTLCNYKMTGI